MIKIRDIFKEKFSEEEELTDILEDDYLIVEDDTNFKKRFNTVNFSEDQGKEIKWSIPDWLIGLLPRGKILFGRKIFLILAALGLILSFLSYSYFHVGEAYTVIRSNERKDISGTTYMEYGKNLLKYSPDGVSCVNYLGDVLWSTTFSMQTPIADICNNAVVVADQKGTQIYIFNEKGQIGKFQTLMPIDKVRVAEQGVVLAVLEDGDTTWINFYDTSGNEIANNRTTIGESGYPLDIALSPDGLKVMLSYLYATEGNMSTKISFHNFDTVGQAEINNLVNEEIYKNEVIPKVMFIDEGTSVAFRSDGFSIFKGKQIPEQKANIVFEEEILSIFYSKSYLGFVFESTNSDHKYKIRLYDTSGKRILEKHIDYNYKQIKISNNQIIIFNDKEIIIYGINGHLKFKGDYAKPVADVIGVNGLRKYFVLTTESTDLIRLK